jgi:hypothetical protein
MLVAATLFHDTFSKQGRAAFPEIPHAAPEGFAGASPHVGFRTEMAG